MDRPEDIYPLSPLQQGMLFETLQTPESGVCFEQDVYVIRGKLDRVAFEEAWKRVIARHPVLRSSFIWEDIEEPHQIVHHEGSLDLHEEDWREYADAQNRLQRFMRAERQRGFDLTQLPLLRLGLFRTKETEYHLVWSFHHAILDGWSLPLVMQDVLDHYASAADSASASPTPPAFRNYIAWLLEQDIARAEVFWRHTLKGFSSPTPLTVDHRADPGEAVTDETFQRSLHRLPRPTTEALNAFGRAQNLTLASIVQGAWAILLSRYASLEEVVFGCNTSGRPPGLDRVEEMVGLFINTLPLRVPTPRGTLVQSWLQTVQDRVLELREYEYSSLSKVQKWSDIAPGRQLFESIVVFENYPSLRSNRLDLDVSYRSWERHSKTGYPLTLLALPGEELLLELKFDARRFDRATIERMLGHYCSLLDAIATRPDCAIDELPLLTAAEREELIHGFNRPLKPLNKTRLPLEGGTTLHALFEAQVAKTPNAIALTCDGQTVSYAQLNAQANRLAHRLRTFGIGPDVLVGICMDRTNDLVVGLLAILKAGGAYLPIDLAYPADRLAFMLEDAKAPVLLAQRKLVSTLPATTAKILCVDEVLAQATEANEETNLPATAGPDHLAYVIYTSGTTGKPKGSLITHRNVVRLFPATEHWYHFDERDVWTLFHSTAFDFSVWELWGALLYGGRLVVVPFMVSRSPEAFYELLAAEGVTVLNQTPSAFRQLIQAEEAVGQKPLALRSVIFGGEALEMQSLRPWFERHGDQQPQLVNMYGITETTVHVTYRALSKNDLNSGSVIGVPIPDLQIYILDTKLQPVPIGVPGEMYVGGAGLARGYLWRPDLTADRFIPDHLSGRPSGRLYKTGDLARFLPGRDVEYLGRIDHQVKIRGFRIELGEIESVLCQHPQVREAIVLAREDTIGSKRLVGYLAVTAPAPAVSELRDHLRKKLPDYMVPAVFVFLEKLPLTNNGKIDRQALPEPEQDRPELAAAYVAPRNEFETKLAEIWSRVLRVENVGVHDNFFELGGDSILSIQIISLGRQVGLNLTPKLLFQHPTIADLASAAKPVVAAPKIAQGLVEGSAPLTPIQHWFFEQNLAEPQWYNQSFIFTVSDPLELTTFSQALILLEKQHDALRIRWSSKTNSPAEISFSGGVGSVALERVDLSATPEAQLASAMETLGTRAQAHLDFVDGPLWRVTYCDLGRSRPHRVLFAVHHLAVDGVSWRILLEDLEKFYLQLQKGENAQLPPKTTSAKEWAECLSAFAKESPTHLGLVHWQAAVEGTKAALPFELNEGENIEASTNTLVLRLEPAETEALLKRAPAAYNTQINDLLLTALTLAVGDWTKTNSLFLNLEGHGREDLFENADLSRTVGWFTSIYPVRLSLLDRENISSSIKAIKEQLRAVPARGIGYGILRYLARNEQLNRGQEPEILFNYLGQLDQLVEGSRLFAFAPESTGPWHSPKQKRRHALELNCAVVNRRLELSWTFSRNQFRNEAIDTLAKSFVGALREVVTHCLQPGVRGFTPSDFPLAALPQAALDALLVRIPDLEDVYPLTPIQALFYSVGVSDAQAVTDQWHCTLTGALDLELFRTAWKQVIMRHSILRTSFHSNGLKEPVQVVHRKADLPWSLEDWRGESSESQAARWSAFLQRERGRGLSLETAPLHRVTLIRLSDEQFKFLWIVPALLLDGWSWPLVFRDLSRIYGALRNSNSNTLSPVRPYRDGVAWLRQRTSAEDEKFWRDELKGITHPTPLISEPGELPTSAKRESGEWSQTLDATTTARLIAFARQLHITANTLILAAWSFVLARQSGRSDVMFGAAFSGRSTELPDSGNIVGPFVNNLPIRVAVESASTVEDYLKRLHDDLLELNLHQFAPLAQIQSWSEVAWRDRLFESLVVVQNYEVDESARRLGDDVAIAEFSGPIHTNFPLLVLVEPGATWKVSLIHDRRALAAGRVASWGKDLTDVLATLVDERSSSLDKLVQRLSPPASALAAKPRLRVQSLNYLPPQTELQRTISKVWQEMFQMERISIEENLFDLGAHSLFVTRLYLRLRETLNREFPLVDLFQYPTISSLARHLDVQVKDTSGAEIQNRAQQQRDALARLRRPVAKK